MDELFCTYGACCHLCSDWYRCMQFTKIPHQRSEPQWPNKQTNSENCGRVFEISLSFHQQSFTNCITIWALSLSLLLFYNRFALALRFLLVFYFWRRLCGPIDHEISRVWVCASVAVWCMTFNRMNYDPQKSNHKLIQFTSIIDWFRLCNALLYHLCIYFYSMSEHISHLLALSATESRQFRLI